MEYISENSKRKRIVIAIIYGVIFLLIVSWIISSMKPKPNCFDGKLNQDEERVDCGGVCQKECEKNAEEAIKINETGFVASGLVNKYDIYGKIINPNDFFGSGEFSYHFIVRGSGGSVLAERNGVNFILPGEEKYLIETNVETTERPIAVELVVSGVAWKKITTDDYRNPSLKIVNKNYDEIRSGVGFSEATGLVKNESQFDFETIKVYIILKAAGGEILALHSTQMNSVRSGENRDFKVSWPSRFPGDVQGVDVQADVNVFKSESFSKRFFETERFQEY